MPTPLHEQITADAYWEGPSAPESSRPFGQALLDAFTQTDQGRMAAIDIIYRQCRSGSTLVTPLEAGRPLQLNIPGSVLKIVEDMRCKPKKITAKRECVAPEEFDAQAAAMEATPWYQGPQVGTRVEGPDGTIEVARRVVYLVNPARGLWLVGKDSALLGHGGHEINAVHMPPMSVGDIQQHETRRDVVAQRIVSACILTPAARTKEKARVARAVPVRTPRLTLGTILPQPAL